MFGRAKFGEFVLFEHKNFGGLIDYSKGYWFGESFAFLLPNFPTILYYFNIPVLSGYNSITSIYL